MEIPGYRIVRELGRGGMATVFLAVQESLGRQVALKVMSQGLASSEAFKERFLREGRIVAHLNHRNIVTIYDVGIVGDVYFIAMEYVVGRSLDERIQEGLTTRQCAFIVKRVARALGHAHEQGFVHRDVKPSNILFRDDRNAVLTDFGIAKSLLQDKGLTKTGLTPGTPTYMSPEQLRGRPLDGRSDLYSLGVVLYEMLTRDRPFEANTGIAIALKHLNEPPPELPEQFSTLRPIMACLLAKEPKNRFSNAAELVKALDQVTAERPVLSARDIDKTAVEPEAARHEPEYARTRISQTQFEGAPSTTAQPARTEFEQASPAFVATAGERSRTRAAKKFQAKPLLWGLAILVAAAAIVMAVKPLVLREYERNRQEQLSIARLLTTAHQQLAAAHLFEPKRDNAYQTYQKVLALEAGDPGALKGLTRIADKTEQQARAARSFGNFDKSLALIRQGLTADPGHEGLLNLRKDVEVALSQIHQRHKIKELLSQADQDIKQKRFTQPKGNNAYQKLGTVLKIDSNNETARAGIGRIVAHLEDLARARQSAGDLQAGLALVDEGLMINPDYEGLQALRRQMRGQISAAKESQAIAETLAQANTQLEAGHLTSPDGANALETYRKVLSKDPDSQPAQAGIEQIAESLEDRARAMLPSRKYEQALADANHALKLFPERKGLLELREEIHSAQQNQHQQEQVTALLERAQRQVAKGNYLEPYDGSALQIYEQTRTIDPSNAEVQQGLQNIAAHFLAQGRDAQNSGQSEPALAAVSDGLRAVPNDRDLLNLKASIRRQQVQDLQRERRVAQLLATAKTQMSQGRIMAPEGNNAYATYQKALTLDPGNTAVRGGIAKIPDRIYKNAQEKYRAGSYEESLALVRQGRQVDPGHIRLTALEKQVQARIKQNLQAESTQKHIADLLELAQQQLAAIKLTLPDGDNAFESYQEVLSLDASNRQAKSGLGEIANRYAELARAKRTAGDLRVALAMAERGLTIDPGRPALQSLRDAIDRELGKREARDHEVEQLLTKARQRLEAGQLTTPQGNNAYDTYRQALKIDPQNQQAQQGIQTIADRYEYLAKAKREAGDLQDGLKSVALGLSVDPDHSGLQALQVEIQDGLRSQAERKQELNELYAQMRRQLDEQRLSQPAGDNAYETIQAILQIEPDNARAQDALQELLTQYESLARERERQGNFQEGLAFVEQGLGIDPDHPGLLTLQKDLNREIKVNHQKEAKVRSAPVVEVTPQPETAPEPERKPGEPEEPPPMRTFGTF